VKQSLSHTVWECKYHIVWVPKKRRKIVYGKLRKELGIILRRLCEYKGVDVVEGTLCADHIHMCHSMFSSQPYTNPPQREKSICAHTIRLPGN
jgi:putative transposase